MKQFFSNTAKIKKNKVEFTKKSTNSDRWLSDQTAHIVLSDLEVHHTQKCLRHASDQWVTVLQSVIE